MGNITAGVREKWVILLVKCIPILTGISVTFKSLQEFTLSHTYIHINVHRDIST